MVAAAPPGKPPLECLAETRGSGNDEADRRSGNHRRRDRTRQALRAAPEGQGRLLDEMPGEAASKTVRGRESRILTDHRFSPGSRKTMGETADPLPLDGIRVLDLTRARAGPTAVRQLADWGADCVMIEPPVALDISDTMSGPRHGPDYQNLHRNKRSMTLNLKTPEGIEILRRMVAEADVLVENYRPDVKHRLRIDYESLGGGEPAADLCQHLRLRPERALSRPAGLRPDRPGHGRAHVHHRPARPGAGARRRPHRRSDRRALHRHRHPAGADRAPALGPRPMGS